MKKLFVLVATTIISVAMFASREVVPSDDDLASYATKTYTMCIYNETACNDIVLNGTYAGWNAANELEKFQAVTGFDGWYVVSWNDTTGAEAKYGGVQAKPIQLDGIGLFNWDYQLGPDAELVRGTATLTPGYNGTEVDIKEIGAGIVVIDVKSWKNNPCTVVYHTYNFTLISPDCNEEDYITPAISGGFNNWAQEAMTLNELKTAERQQANLPGAVFEYSAKAAEGAQFKFRSAAEWGADWSNKLKEYDAENDEWKEYNGGQNLVLGEETNLVFDLGDPTKYSWDGCYMEMPSVKIGDLYYNLNTQKQTAEVTYELAWDYYNNYLGLTTVNIPSSVSYGGKIYSVTSIGIGAFYASKSLTSVTIPNSVTCIKRHAFMGCSGLTSITIPNSITSIKGAAFHSCTSLTSVHCIGTTPPVLLPEDMGSMLHFEGCYELSHIYVPCGTLDAYRNAWSEYSSLMAHEPIPYTITANVNNSDAGYVNCPQGTICDNKTTMTAISEYGYHFVQWLDGVKDNPRTIDVTQDTTFTAEFAKDEYTITTASSNSEWGSTTGITALYLDEVEISATPNYGYHFVSWNDGNTNNPRIITVTKDETYTATFAKNTYSIAKQTNAEQGYISGASQAEYLDFVTLEAVSNYGYHFNQWSDGLKDNPRIVQLTKDTTFTAEFAYDRVGTCGKDLALVWSYDPVAKVLTIGNEGAFTENMQFGVEAPSEMEELVIGHNVTSIGDRAFAGIETLKKVTIGESVKTIGEQAFYNCVNLETIYNYRPTPTNAYSTAFDGVDKFECALYVLPNSLDMYKNASVWRDFYYTYAIGATAATVNEVSVTPTVNTASVAWPAVENAFTYELVIKDKSGNVVCTLVFNANGQLTSIVFAAPGRSQASTHATGFSFTVTGLDSGTGYDLTINAKNSEGEVIYATTRSFTTASDVTTGIDDIESSATHVGQKLLRDGQLFILRDSKTYTIQGQEVR